MIPETSPLWNFTQLQPNWDTYGAKVIDPATLERAQEFYDKMSLIFYPDQMPEVFPRACGGVSFEWFCHRLPDSDFMISFDTDGTMSWSMELPYEPEAEGKETRIERLVAIAAIWWSHQIAEFSNE